MNLSLNQHFIQGKNIIQLAIVAVTTQMYLKDYLTMLKKGKLR